MKRVVPPLAMFAVSALLLAPTFGQEQTQFDPKILDAFTVRNIGPANMGGRITDLAVVESDPNTFYVASATGGVWKTTDGGDTMKPLFDNQSTSGIGAIAVSASNPNILYLGTGESNPRNSVFPGDGVYKSTDGGATWQHLGLKETHHIGRIAVHPKEPNIVFVAAMGRYWAPNKERGLYKSSDGGKTWQMSKYLDENTGFIDVKMDPEQPDILYAAAYCVRRNAFSGGNPTTQFGKNAGLYKTTDGGATWVKMTDGLPTLQVGRCGISIYSKNPNVIMAVMQTQKAAGGSTATGEAGTSKGDPNAGGVFRSEDRGKTWKHLNTLCPRPFYYGQIRIDPNDDRRIYVLGVQFYTSKDGGKTFANMPGVTFGGFVKLGMHVDHHALWINPKDSKHLILGNDGGLYISKDQTASWEAIRRMAIGQFYAIAVDNRKPYYVHGGLQDNGSWGGPSANFTQGGIVLGDWKSIGRDDAFFDGYYCAVDPNDPNIVYSETEYGGLHRRILGGKFSSGVSAKSLKPKSGRFNWSSPLIHSLHNPTTLYFGGNVLFRLDDRGEKTTAISPDLTRVKTAKGTGGNTLTTISESPLNQGLLYTGADDGALYVTRNGGKDWTDLTNKVPNLPLDRWITRVEASHHDEGTMYLSITRYRNNDYKPYLFKTTDYGQTWTSIVSNLPDHGPVHVIKESSKRKGLIFVGTEYALYVSVDDGKHWHRLGKGLPTVPVHDLLIHPRDRDLVIATHGRSIWVTDISPLEQMTPKVLASNTHVFEVRPAVAHVRSKAAPARKNFVGENPPYGAIIHYYLRQGSASAQVVITDKSGKELAKLAGGNQAGLHQVVWDLNAAGAPGTVPPGEYTARLQAGGQTLTQTVRVEAPE